MYLSPGIAFGFHGCDQTVFDRVIKQGEHLSASENDYDWLGHGIYFWEGSCERALEWAQQSKSIHTPAVVGAVIKLGNCVDLLDSFYLNQAQIAYQILSREFEELGKPLPENRLRDKNGITFLRDLDCQVIMRLHQMNNQAIMEDLSLSDMQGQNKRKVQNHPSFLDSVRGMFPEGDPLYSNAGFQSRNHIQLCIVNPNAIVGYFDPRHRNVWYKPV
ncbi:hypothetical protein ABMA58_03595 [Oceanospirillum sp. HFRX-1_2]